MNSKQRHLRQALSWIFLGALLISLWVLLGSGDTPKPGGVKSDLESVETSLLPSPQQIEARREVAEVERSRIEPNRDDPSELPSTFIRGRVTNRRGDGIPGAEVRFWATVRNRRYPITITHTDDIGYYVADSRSYLSGISPITAASGSVVGNASAENYLTEEIYFENQPARNHRFNCDFVLRGGLDHRVIGRVLKEDGAAAAFAEVNLTHLDDDGGYGAGGTTTDSDGYYVFDHCGDLRGEADYRVVASMAGAGTSISSELTFGDQAEIRLPDLTLRFDGDVIEGYLLYPNGLPAQEARVVATRPDDINHGFDDEPIPLDFDSALNGQPQPIAGAITDSRGWFRLSGLAEGEYDVQALGDRLEEGPVLARSGDRDVRLTYYGHRLSLEITDTAGHVARGANFEVTWSGDDESDLFDPIGPRLWFHVEPGPASAQASSTRTYSEESSFTILDEIHETEVRLILRLKDSNPVPWDLTIRDPGGRSLPWSRGFVFDASSGGLIITLESLEDPPSLPANSYRFYILAGERPWPAIPETWYFPVDEEFTVRGNGANSFTENAKPGGRVRLALERAEGDLAPLRDVVVRTVGPLPASHRFVREGILGRVRKVNYWRQRNSLRMPVGPDVPSRMGAHLWVGGETYVSTKPIATGPQRIRFECSGRPPVDVTVDVQPMKFTDVEIHLPRASED